jgi:thermitase
MTRMTKNNNILKVAGSFFALGAFIQPNFAALHPHVDGELIIKFKRGIQKNSSQALKSVGAEIVETVKLSYGNVHIARYNSNEKSLDAILKRLENDPNVEYVEPNFIYKLIEPVKSVNINQLINPIQVMNYTPNDPRYGQLWGLENSGRNDPSGTVGISGADINAVRAWGITKGSRAIKIAVIDTGVDYNHPDLVGNMWVNTAEKNGLPGVDDDGNGYVDDIHGYDFANDDGDPMDGNNHGTHCAGTIGAVHNNGIGVAGVMADVEIVGIKFLTDTGSGSTINAIKSIDYATKLNVDIMSNSWGGGARSEALQEAIQRASDAGIVFTAAAGNSRSNNDSSPHYPSNYSVENVISVAAHTAQDNLASFSSYGKRTVHIAAPGHNIVSTVAGNGYASFSGTSMATPHVSGGLGLLLAQSGRLSHSDLRNRLMETSVPVSAYRSKVIKGGRMDVYNLLTDTRPARNEPKDSEWKTIRLADSWESNHPYGVNLNESRTFQKVGAKFMRLVVKRYEFEERYDYVQVATAAGAITEQISGVGADYKSDYVEGDTLIATFKSDRSITKWGFLIEEIQWQ